MLCGKQASLVSSCIETVRNFQPFVAGLGPRIEEVVWGKARVLMEAMGLR